MNRTLFSPGVAHSCRSGGPRSSASCMNDGFDADGNAVEGRIPAGCVDECARVEEIHVVPGLQLSREVECSAFDGVPPAVRHVHRSYSYLRGYLDAHRDLAG